MKATIMYTDVKTRQSSKSNFWNSTADRANRKIQQLAIFKSPDGTIYLCTDPYIPESTVFTLINQTDNITEVLVPDQTVALDPQKQYQLTICMSFEFKDHSTRVETWTVDFLPNDSPETKEV